MRLVLYKSDAWWGLAWPSGIVVMIKQNRVLAVEAARMTCVCVVSIKDAVGRIYLVAVPRIYHFRTHFEFMPQIVLCKSMKIAS